MLKTKMFEIVNVEFDKRKTVFKKGKTEIQSFRPSKLLVRFKDYALKRIFDID